uniref:DUF4371 domain-containing protein n=1 Tax=Panagrellus redivivus TaxID=6233 RepID=A0A7E4V595_PANRE
MLKKLSRLSRISNQIKDKGDVGPFNSWNSKDKLVSLVFQKCKDVLRQIVPCIDTKSVEFVTVNSMNHSEVLVIGLLLAKVVSVDKNMDLVCFLGCDIEMRHSMTAANIQKPFMISAQLTDRGFFTSVISQPLFEIYTCSVQVARVIETSGRQVVLMVMWTEMKVHKYDYLQK